MKRKIALLAATALMLGGIPAVQIPQTIQAEESAYENIPMMDASKFEATMIDGKFTLTKYTGDITQNMAVPAYVNGQLVQALGKSLFVGTSQVVRMYLPDTLEIIDEDCFQGCGLQAVGSYTYQQNAAAVGVVESASIETPNISTSNYVFSENLPSHLSVIGARAFEKTNLNINAISVNSHITSIGERAFADSNNLQQFNILAGAVVDRIAANAFTNNNVHEIHVYGSIGTIAERAFESVPNLTNFIIEEGGNVSTLEPYAFYGCGSLHYVTLRGVTSIGSYAFSTCKNMENVYVSSNGTYTLGEYAFKDTAIHNVNLEPGIATIEKGTFENCENIVTIHLPETVTKIEADAFKNINTLQELTISDEAVVDPTAFAGAAGTTLDTLNKTTNNSIREAIGLDPIVKKSPKTTIDKVKLKKIAVKKKKRKATLKWTKSSNAKGYVIYKKVVKKGKKAKKAKFKKFKTIKKNTCKCVVKLKKHTTTFFYVKAFGTINENDKKVTKYSKASNTKKVKIK